MGADVSANQSTARESAYVVRNGVSAEAITRSLQALVSLRHHPIARRRFTVLDTFDGRVRRAGGRLTRAGDNGTSTVAWQPRGGSRLSTHLKQPVSFAWDLPDGPLQRALTPVIGVRRLLAQADAEEYGSLLEILDDQDKTVARLRIESGRARLPAPRKAWQPLPTVITLTGLRGYEDVFERLVPLIESRPGVESCPEGLHGVILRQIGAAERSDVSSLRVELAPTVGADVGARQIHLALLGILVVNEPGSPRQPGHGVSPRLPCGHPAHTLAARADQARIPARRRRALLDRVLVGRSPHRPAARSGRARDSSSESIRETFLPATWRR